MMVGFLVLAITLGSLLAAGLPLLTAIIGVGIGLVGLQALTDVIEVSETAPILATMLGLAVGIDYALFILTRYRSNLSEGMEGREAAAHATATAGSAVVFAGATVVIALVGLLVVNIPFLTVMGMAAAGTVSIAVLIALTLLPAIFGFAGKRLVRTNRLVTWRPRKRTGDTMSIRYAKFVTRRPWAILLVSVGLLGAIAVPATHMELGLPDAGSDPEDTTTRQAYDLLEEGFGPGFNGPLTVVVDAPNLPASEQARVAGAVTEGLKEFDGVAAVSQPAQNEAGDLTVVQVTPTSGPTTQETRDLVTALRDKADEVNAASGIDAYVTGQTAINIDTADRLNASLAKYVLVVVGLALILLTIVFRSVLVPIKAAAGFLLSIAASLGLVVWIFQDGNLADVFGVAQTGPILSFLPILLIGILFGLAMDYEVFLVSRMREHFSKTGKAKESVITGYGQSGRVVTAAAIIMTAVFAAFILAPSPITKSIGLSLAFGVLVDAFVIRMTVVPAVMVLLGKRAWWMPKRLGRILPEVDIEGEKLATA
jgi:RND superfamily putative drug exporter